MQRTLETVDREGIQENWLSKSKLPKNISAKISGQTGDQNSWNKTRGLDKDLLPNVDSVNKVWLDSNNQIIMPLILLIQDPNCLNCSFKIPKTEPYFKRIHVRLLLVLVLVVLVIGVSIS